MSEFFFTPVYETEYDEDLNEVKELTDISDLNQKETRNLIKSINEANLLEVDVLIKIFKVYQKLLFIESITD